MRTFFFLLFNLLLVGSFTCLEAQNQSVESTSGKDSPVFTVVEEMPEFPGGDEARLKFLADNIEYPKIAKESGIQGTVYATFVIDTNGRITDAKILRGIGGGCDEEMLRVLSLMPTWKAGKQAGKKVRVQFTMPMRFTLDGGGNAFVSGSGKPKIQVYSYFGFSSHTLEAPAGMDAEPVMRFTGFPNVEVHYNFIRTNNVTAYTGLNVVNMGVSLKDSVKHTYRYLGIGIPLAVRFHDSERKFNVELGGGVDIPFHFKEKHYYDEDKEKDSKFYSEQLNPIQPYVFAAIGFQFMQIRFRYFTGEFFNKDYTVSINSVEVKPYAGIKCQPFEIALVFGD